MTSHSEHAHPTPHPNYIIIWAVLVVLFVASVSFSIVTSFAVGVVFAFFIAIIKALMVAAWFMHLNIEQKWVWIILTGGLLTIFVMWMGIAPDVMETEGLNWSKIPQAVQPK